MIDETVHTLDAWGYTVAIARHSTHVECRAYAVARYSSPREYLQAGCADLAQTTTKLTAARAAFTVRVWPDGQADWEFCRDVALRTTGHDDVLNLTKVMRWCSEKAGQLCAK